MNVNSDRSRKLYFVIIGLLIIFLALLIALLFSKISTPKTYTRTIMIYASPSNLEEDIALATQDLEGIDSSLVDLENVNVLLYTGGTLKWHNFVSSEENAIYELTSDGFVKKESYDTLNTASPDTLNSFLNYCYENFKTDKYDLIFYDHGNGLQGVIVDDHNESSDFITPQELDSAFKNSPFKDDNKLEMVIFRTCLMGTIEVADILSNYSDYMVGSPEVSLGYNPADSVLKFINNITGESSAYDIATSFIDGYKKFIDDTIGNYYLVQTYSFIDLSKASSLEEKIGEYVNSIDLSKYYSDVEKVRANLYEFGEDSHFDMYDLYSFIDKTNSYSTMDSSELISLFNEMNLYTYSTRDDVKGLSIYIPDPSTLNNVTEVKYSNLFKKVYSDLNLNSNYLKFIDSYTSYATGKTATSLTTLKLNDNKSSIITKNNKKEFTLELTDEQYNEYSSAGYVVFRKMNDDYYMPVFMSSNVSVDDNTISTNISNKIIKLKNQTDNNGNIIDDAYLQIIDASTENGEAYTTTGIAYDNRSDDMADWEVYGVKYNFLVKNNQPYLSSITEIPGKDSEVPAVVTLNTSDLSVLDLMTFWYKIFDDNGNFTTDWSSYSTYYGYDVDLEDGENVEVEFTSLEDTTDYYCVFAIKDIYGNTSYSKAVQIK